MFIIPDNLEQYSVAGLRDLVKIADAEFKALVASVTSPADAEDEQLDRGEELKAFIATAEARIKDREGKVARFAKMSEPEAEDEEEASEAPASEGDGSEDEDKKDFTAQVTAPNATVVSATITKTAPEVIRPSLADISAGSDSTEVAVRGSNGQQYTIVAAADLGGEFATGESLAWESLGKAFEQRTRGYPKPQQVRKGAKHARLQHTFAVVERNFPDDQQLLDNDGELVLHKKLNGVSKKATQAAAGEMQSLTAAVGWCAPSETIYSVCNPVTSEGLLDLPEVVARRGGIRHNQGIDWVTFFGGTYPALDTNVPGMSILTEAQVIADTAKTCLEIDCPAFIDERLNVAALCLTGSLLQNRGYPEYVTEFTQGAMAAFAHFLNREIIDIIEDGSTAVVLSGVDPWVTDGSVVSQIMSAVDLAATDMRYRLRLGINQPIEIVLPLWLKVQMRADWIRRNAESNPNLTDAMINAMFATRNVRVQWVYDWQDAFSGVAGGAGATTAPQNFPSLTATPTVRFLAFVPGTWILARQDVIRLDTVYDSVNLQQNLVTQLFMEDGFLPMRMCPQSQTRVYTVNVCPTGSTGVQRAVACTDVTP